MKGFLKLFLLLLFIVLVQLSEDADILILGNNKYCITNSTSAIIFNGDIDKTDDNAILVSNIYPPPPGSRIECNFGDNGDCDFYGLWKQDNWYEQKSLYTKAPEIITDRRWEKFPIRKTTGDLSKNLVYVEIFNSLTDNINIALSIRIKQEAHIYLCDGNTPVSSNCYWIMLGSDSGTMSKIRKCKRGQISYQSKKYPNDPICKDGLNKTTVNPLDENEWKHFMIQKYQGVLRVYHDNKVFLEISDPYHFYTPQRLFIHSKKVDGLWKIHSYKFFESLTKTSAQDQLGPSFRQQGEFCISLYVKTSIYSFLRIKIICNQFTLITKDVSTNGTWSEIKIHLNESLDSIYSVIFVKKLQTGESDDEAYWAIDDVRQCHGEEYRYIKYTDSDEQECQKISLWKQKTLSLIDQTKKSTSEDGINCPEDRFGTTCVPCYIFGNQYCPENLKYCQSDTDTCYCSAGYTGSRCKTVCSQGFFGQGCRHQGHCLRQYDPVTGECTTCEDPFEGTRCDTTSTPFFVNEPKVYDIESTSFKIQQVDLDVQGYGVEYYFEYLNKDDPSSWQRANKENIPISESPIVTVNAEPDTDYEIRAIVVSSKRSINENYSKYTIPIYTTCKKITADEIQIQARNNSATITLQLSSDSCQISKYCYVINNSICNFFRKTVIEVPKLKPFFKNTIIFRHSKDSVTIHFNTTEGVPSEVTAIKHAEFSNTIKLTWNDPVEKNGEIVAYEIKYRLVKNRACAGETHGTFSSENVTVKEIALDNLNPYSTYQIIVTAFTNAYKGKSQQLFLETTPATELSDNEIIKIESMVPKKYDSDLYMNEILCTYITGPINIQILIFCISEWCYGINNNYMWNYTRDHAILIPNLRPYTNYNFTLWISRDHQNWAYSDSKLTQTKPDVPHSVSDFNVYTKDENSISLRWRPPNPPTGILAEYKIKYTFYYHVTYGPYYKIITVPETKCKLWNEFHCATITQAVALDYIFDITISARNEDPITYGSFNEIQISNTNEGPQPPFDLNYNWTENNELFIYWFHPNNTNGRLTSFEILDQLSANDYYRIASEDDYKLHYKYKFTGTYKACEKFQLYVRAHNVNGMSRYMPLTINNPPIIPTIADVNSYTSTEHTISVNVQFESLVQTVYILVSNHDKTDDLALFEEGIRENQVPYNNLTTSRIVYEDTKLNSLIFEIGHENYTSKNWSNTPLDSGREYCISVFLINKCNNTGMTRIKRIQKFVSTEGENTNIDKGATNGEETTNDGGGLWALLILILFPIAIGIWYARKRNIDFNKIVRPPSKTKSTDELPLTDKTPTINPRIHVVKPKPTIILPALQTKHSKKIPIIEFENYVKESIESGELERQHNLFPKGLVKPHNVGSLPANKNKNRYKNLLAYDHTRVKLKDYIKEENVGYINANYIDGYRKPRAYIATQGPKNNTLGDFWWMIWQENIKDIVMLANIHENGKKKVEKYWPDINEEKIYGLIKVQYISETVFANFVLRVFNVQYKSDERKVSQMHYTTWPDHGVPLYSQSLVPYLQKLLKIPHNSQTPILVHCSAGVGRTGTIILSDICLRMAAGEGYLDFLAHLENLRSQRANLVDNIEQYKLAHLVVLECLFGMRTSIPCTDDMRSIVEVTLNNNGIKTQMKYILETQWQDMAMETMLENDEIAPIYNEKNRVKDIVPENYRVYITRYPHDDEKSSYINAVLVDDFANPGRYIVTQQPLPNTLGDFWRLVVERSCTEIISLNTINLEDESVCQIWPEKGEELIPVDFIKIIHKRTQRLNFYKVITVQLEVKQSKLSTLTDATMEVNIIALDNWRSEDLLPNSIEEFLAFRDAADAMARTSEYVIVTCYDGAKASGLYLAMSFLIEQMKLEQECDVCLAVRSIRHSRKQFVTTEEQYEFLYRAAVTFISGFQPYSNFS